jgi:hypothetical protein
MSSIEQAKESIKKKMKLMDYEAIPQNVDTSKPQEVNTPKQEKVKVTMYLSEEHWKMFNELCLEEMKRSGKPEKSKILCDAIEHLYKLRTST